MRRIRFRSSIATVTLPTSGTYRTPGTCPLPTTAAAASAAAARARAAGSDAPPLPGQ